MKKKTLMLTLAVAVLTLTGLAAPAETEDAAIQALNVESADQAVTLNQAASALNLEQTAQINMSGCTRAECFQALLLCDATCASYPPNDQPLCYQYCEDEFFECLENCH